MGTNALYKRIIYSSIRHGLVTVNRDGQIIVVNQVAQDILPGLKSTNMHISTSGLAPDMVKAVMGAGTGLTYLRKQSQLVTGDRCLSLSWDAAPLIADNGEITGAILLFEDLTDTLAMALQVKEWDRLAVAGEIAAGLAHEMRNPLAAAQGALQLYKMASSAAQRKELFDLFSQELERMDAILTKFVDTIEPPRDDQQNFIDLKAVIGEISFMIRSEALLYNSELIVSPCKSGLPRVVGDAASIKKVFLCIAKNAIEAMPEGGSLVISLDWDDAGVWVDFKDNGPGISPEHKDNIFKPFFTTKVGGTGLGLAISQRIVKGVGGDIKVQSSRGTGTVFTVSFPFAPQKQGGKSIEFTNSPSSYRRR